MGAYEIHLCGRRKRKIDENEENKANVIKCEQDETRRLKRCPW